MAVNFPTIGEYNLTIQKNGSGAFRSLSNVRLIEARTTPIKIFLFGSGAYAAVFKGHLYGKKYAIRCFLSTAEESFYRSKIICDYLRGINADWKIDCEFIENEFVFNGNTFPVLKMEWVDGLLINLFVSQHLNDNSVLTKLQEKLVEVSSSLEKNIIGHGDIQSGNVIITGNANNFEVKLIDYDGMYIPKLSYKNAIEAGRSEFQHPKRTLRDFNPEMDRFAFWVIITALEALKLDKTLWLEVMQGGFNTLDNFLFTSKDFLNPSHSSLFNRLYKLNSATLKLYLDKLKSISIGDFSEIPAPKLFLSSDSSSQFLSSEHGFKNYNNLEIKSNDYIDKTKFKITVSSGTASVLTSTFQHLGSTPLELDKDKFEGKVIIVTNHKESKRITLSSNQNLIIVNFD